MSSGRYHAELEPLLSGSTALPPKKSLNNLSIAVCRLASSPTGLQRVIAILHTSCWTSKALKYGFHRLNYPARARLKHNSNRSKRRAVTVDRGLKFGASVVGCGLPWFAEPLQPRRSVS